MRVIAMYWCSLLLAPALLKADVLGDLSARDGMAGQFVQEIVSPDGLIIDQSSGSFSLLRPHFLRWEILDPERQLILADDQQLTQIDWDLEVVVVRPISEEARSPLNWLLASRSELESAFDVVSAETTAVLVPRDPGAPYGRLEMSRLSPSDWRLDAVDRAGQTLRVTLSENIDTPPRQADFVVPETPF